MTFAVLAGLVIGLAGGGSWHNLGRRSFRLWPVLVTALVAQVVAGRGGPRSGELVIASYGLLAAFAVANLHLAGMAVVLVGLSMNLAVIVVNRGMPVRPGALVTAGLARPEELADLDLDLGAKRHLERPDDRLVTLGDTIGVPGAGQVVSFGDLVLGAGTAAVTTRLLHRPGLSRRGRWTRGAHAGGRRGRRHPSPERA